jgi:hypothetical protein
VSVALLTELEAGASRGDGLTLEQVLEGVRERLAADDTADCPVCDGRMVRVESAGRCLDCGSSLD